MKSITWKKLKRNVMHFIGICILFVSSAIVGFCIGWCIKGGKLWV